MRLTFLGHAAVRSEIEDHDVLVRPSRADDPRAERVVPIHGATFPHMGQDAEAFRAYVGPDSDARGEILAPRQSLGR